MAAKHDMDDGTEELKCIKCDDEICKAVVRSINVDILWSDLMISFNYCDQSKWFNQSLIKSQHSFVSCYDRLMELVHFSVKPTRK